ncbi:renalase-like [Saccoglossus kowalevskii]
MTSSVTRILIVGAGLTGAVTASILRRELREQVKIVVLDKSREAGGRMSTSRCPEDVRCTADLGAQYITQTSIYAKQHASFYEELLSNHIIEPFVGMIEGEKPSEDDKRNYITPDGSNTVVKYFLNQADGQVTYNKTVCKVDVQEENGKSCLHATTENENEKMGLFDIVVITVPVPQAIKIGGIVQQGLEASPELKSLLDSVVYSSRYALGLYFKPGSNIDVPWCGKYEYKDPCIRWMAVDAKKRGKENSDVGSSLVVHTSAPFGIQHLETDKDQVQVIVIDHLKKLLLNLPQPISIKCQRWRYSQVFKCVPDSPGTLVVKETPSYMVLLGGDAFTHSNFDGCISSATAIANKIITFLKANKV